jgi:HSP20 family protein
MNMSELTLWKKQELDKLRQDLDILFRQFRRGFGVPRSFLEGPDMPATRLSETEDRLILSAELPDIKPENIHVTVTDDTLSLRAESVGDVVQPDDGVKKIEKHTYSFARSIALPCRIVSEDVKATFKDNILTIELPKCKPKAAMGVNIEVT